MNPWKIALLDILRNLIRFAIWTAAMVSVAMISVFVVVFTFHFLRHLWDWCRRHWFAAPW